jgi:3,4-dihydroxy 2-butanone 4-phosphate synthase/GTP cyclohydrolase II
MARLPDLIAFAQLHGLKIGTIADLIAYRRRTERQVERVIDTPFESVYGGHFRMLIYRNVLDRTEHVALVKGKIEADKPTLVRVHKVDMAADVLGHVDQRQDLIPRALHAIAAFEGPGAAVFIRSSNPAALSEKYGQSDLPQEETIQRDYGIGAQILLDLGVRDMIFLSGTTRLRLPGSGGYGLRILERREI